MNERRRTWAIAAAVAGVAIATGIVVSLGRPNVEEARPAATASVAPSASSAASSSAEHAIMERRVAQIARERIALSSVLSSQPPLSAESLSSRQRIEISLERLRQTLTLADELMRLHGELAQLPQRSLSLEMERTKAEIEALEVLRQRWGTWKLTGERVQFSRSADEQTYLAALQRARELEYEAEQAAKQAR